MGGLRIGPSSGQEFTRALESLRPNVARALTRLGVPRRHLDDITQDVLFAAFKAAPRYDPRRSSLAGWLHGFAMNLASHYRQRASTRHEELNDRTPSLPSNDAPADDVIASSEERTVIRLALELVPPRERAVLVAHDIDDVPMSEIALASGIPVSTAYKWLYRARHNLKTHLRRADYRLAHEEVRQALRVLPQEGRPRRIQA